MIPPTGSRPRAVATLPGAGSLFACLLSIAHFATPAASHGQIPSGPETGGGAVIDTVIISRQDLFSPEAASGNPFFQFFNQLHVTTRPFVIRRELLLRPGIPYDSLLAAESERNLRQLGLFRSVRVDSANANGKLALRVQTRDAWSLQPRLSARIASDGTLTGSFGVTETNVAGTGNALRVWYIREADRDGIDLRLSANRIGATPLAASAVWLNLSDRDVVTWRLANPFRSFSDRFGIHYEGNSFRGMVPQYRRESASVLDTTQWHRQAFVNQFFVTLAPVANPRHFLRIGAVIEVRAESFLRLPEGEASVDSLRAAAADTVYGLAGAFLEYRRARFARVSRFNGFAEEDQDLSDRVFVSAKLALKEFGYASNGVGARVSAGSGVQAGPAILKGAIDGQGLFNAAGLDSGYVFASTTAAVRQGARNTTFFNGRAGVKKSPHPGAEFDLGFEVLPRLWGPHAFVGTRTIRMTLEHRSYIYDSVLDLFGLGVGAFVDYGGAWYADQNRPLGGNVGITIFGGSPLSSFAQVTNLNFGYRFGGGIEKTDESRWGFSLGGGIRF